jgi:hypothetical protein
MVGLPVLWVGFKRGSVGAAIDDVVVLLRWTRQTSR